MFVFACDRWNHFFAIGEITIYRVREKLDRKLPPVYDFRPKIGRFSAQFAKIDRNFPIFVENRTLTARRSQVCPRKSAIFADFRVEKLNPATAAKKSTAKSTISRRKITASKPIFALRKSKIGARNFQNFPLASPVPASIFSRKSRFFRLKS